MGPLLVTSDLIEIRWATRPIVHPQQKQIGMLVRWSHSMSKFFVPILGTLSIAPDAHADWAVNMPVGVTDISAQIYDLHMFALWICVAIGVVVFGPLIYALIKFRKSKGVRPAQFSHDMLMEVIWTVIPVAILVVLSVPAARILVDIEDTRGTEMTIKITGYQWKWHYEYMGEDVSFYSALAHTSNLARLRNSGIEPSSVENYLLEVDNPLVLPANVRIRFLITANDVLHAWWVPDFAVKKDAIPGFINEGWFKVNDPGVYRGQCAELCGKDHGFMPIVVEVLAEDDYKDWLDSKRAGTAVASAGIPR
jgi:cytochrome c oxidase subunit 2